MKQHGTGVMLTVAMFGTAAAAHGGVTIVQGPTAPSYAMNLNFDEAGGPTGKVEPTAWLATYGITIEAGTGTEFVDDFDDANGGWGLGDGNSFFGNFGVFMTFTDDLTEMSFDAWDPSGPQTPFGGGLGVFVLNDGVEVANAFVTPAWGGVGDPAFNITTDGGMVFDEVRVLGYGFAPTTYVDNLSWNVVPAPGCIAMLGTAFLLGRRRRTA
jgi:hypothetical protein